MRGIISFFKIAFVALILHLFLRLSSYFFTFLHFDVFISGHIYNTRMQFLDHFLIRGEHNAIYVYDDFSQAGTFEFVLLYLISLSDAQHYLSKRN